MLNKVFKNACLVIGLAIFLVALYLTCSFSTAQAEKVKYDMAGWFWTDNYGWISLNSENADLFGLPAASPYKLVIDNDEISGWGWSSNVGWICFGKTCNPNNICDESPGGSCQPFDYGTATPSGGWQIKRDTQTKTVSGWAKVIALKDSGWIHLGVGENASVDQRGVDCYDCQEDTSTPPSITGCNACFTRTKFDGINLPDFNIDSVVGGSGNVCLDCINCQKNLSDDLVSLRVDCSACNSCKIYGGVSDEETGGLLGWGWNGNAHPQISGQTGDEGAGWVQFNALGGESGVVYPWLQTLYGAVFSRNNIRQKAVISGVNATYCIFAKDIFNFRSTNCSKNIVNIDIKFPQKFFVDQSYKNALGRIDLLGLTSKVKTSGGNNYNKYSNVLVELFGNQSWREPVVFNNSVYVINGNLNLENGFLVKNASEGLDRGNGLVVVNGDLTVNGNFEYDNSNVYGIDLKRLASVAWVVKGDVLVNPNVSKAAGAFIVLGNQDNCVYADQTPCSSAVDYPKYQKNGYGVFFSGLSENPLVISGLLVAKAFDLERSYSDIKQGSEKIVYDGRLIANPPPGLKGFLESLPVIRDFEF